MNDVTEAEVIRFAIVEDIVLLANMIEMADSDKADDIRAFELEYLTLKNRYELRGIDMDACREYYKCEVR